LSTTHLVFRKEKTPLSKGILSRASKKVAKREGTSFYYQLPCSS
jgi:hypothetical protein